MNPARKGFEDSYRRHERIILRLSSAQRVIGMTQPEIVQEMRMVFWKAWSTWEPGRGVNMIRWFWVLWLRHKSDLIEHYLASKRDRRQETLTDPSDVALLVEALAPMRVEQEDLIPAPPTDDELGKAVWRLLAHGYERKDVLDVLAISRRRFYRIVESWRTPQVKEMLV